jgi:sulfite exporter TauE/SafE
MQSIFQIFSRLNEPNISLGLIFVVGLLAGFHCIAMCGGIVAGYSLGGHDSGEKHKIRFMPHVHYNLGRIISYSLIGAILGGIGSFFAITPLFQAVVLSLASLFMIIFGLSFFRRLSFLKRIIAFLPSIAMRCPLSKAVSGKIDGPFFVGIFNGFMPCGPLQAMQVYALASGSALHGGLALGIYALGTVPMLFIFGSLITTLSKKYMNKIFTVSGVILVLLGVILGFRAITAWEGTRQPKVAYYPAKASEVQNKNSQTVKMDLTYKGYEPNTLTVKKGIPVRWVINVIEMSGCTNAIVLHGYDIEKKLQYGENIIEFTPKESGEIQFSCWMNMVWGKFIVVN